MCQLDFYFVHGQQCLREKHNKANCTSVPDAKGSAWQQTAKELKLDHSHAEQTRKGQNNPLPVRGVSWATDHEVVGDTVS